ncbi:hypothetical protein OG713_34835 [Streptomyces sp. NBC_00723]|uniref:hypothetical protein n=1 Tax=Streptomyces sp. NBC_00723 TaxID=2903673 RepID=UPI003869FAF9
MLRARYLAVLTLAAALLFVSAPPASAATGPVYSGTGWKAETGQGIYSLAPDAYTVAFADATARTRLKAYFAKPAAQVTAVTGVPVTVTDTIDATPIEACPARHRIVVRYEDRPTGVAGTSQALPCYDTGDGSAWGGHVRMDSEYWAKAAWFSTDAAKNDAYRANAVTHELGHVLGLDHPNVDLDGDGTVEPYECVATATGTRPLQCAPNGGYYNATDAGRFTPPFDEAGLKQLAANWYLRGGT